MKYSNVQRSEYKVIKDALEQGRSVTDLVRDSHRSRTIIYSIKQSRNFADYKRIRSGIGNKSSAVRTKSSRRMTEDKFDKAKALLAAGLKKGQTAEFLNVSRSTIYRVSESPNWAHYQELLAKMNAQRIAYEARLAGDSEPTSTIEEVISYAPSPDERLIESLNANTLALHDLALAWNNLSEKLDEVIETKRPWMSKIKG